MTGDLATIFAALERVRTTDPDRARGMPGVFYTSPAMLEIEREHVFRAGWVCIGHAGEVSKPGDFFTTELVDEPLLVVRGRNGGIKVLSNVCRHRGNLVAEGRGNRKLFLCGYHAWTYDTDGALVGAPLMEGRPAFSKADCGLKPIRSEVWQNFIFVNLDGAATPLADNLAPILPQVRNYHNEERYLYFSREEVWATNWKNLVENFMEGYHLSVTHPKTLDPYTPTSLCQYVPGTEHYAAYKAHYRPVSPQRQPYHPDLTAEERRYSFLFNVFPSFVVTYISHLTVYLCLRPAGPDAVTIRWGIAGHEPEIDPATLAGYVDFANEFNAEDRAKLETLQRGLKSAFYTPGPLAGQDYEGTIQDFHRYLARTLLPLEVTGAVARKTGTRQAMVAAR